MKIITRYTELRVPSYALPYLINGDSSGLEKSEIALINGWYNGFTEEASRRGGRVSIFTSSPETEPHFSNSPEFGLPCDIVECTVVITN